MAWRGGEEKGGEERRGEERGGKGSSVSVMAAFRGRGGEGKGKWWAGWLEWPGGGGKGI